MERIPVSGITTIEIDFWQETPDGLSPIGPEIAELMDPEGANLTGPEAMRAVLAKRRKALKVSEEPVAVSYPPNFRTNGRI